MATQLVTSTSATTLGYSPQNKSEQLSDGTLLYIDFDGSALHLYQITNPAGTPTNTSIKTFSITSSTLLSGDLYVVDNGNGTSDVWVAVAAQTGGSGVQVAHVVYTAAGTTDGSTAGTFGTWDTQTAVPGVSTTAGSICSIVWTGTYLICAWRDFTGTNYNLKFNYTTTKAGTGGWQASSIALESFAAGSGSHRYVHLLHDPTQAATYAIYCTVGTGSNGSEKFYYRSLSDSSTPAIANWSAETSVYATATNVGPGNFGVCIDHAGARIHVVWCDSTASNTKSPGYISGSISGTTPSWGSAIGIGTASTTASQPQAGVDGSGKAFVVWATAAQGSAADIDYATVASPFTSASAATNLTNASSNDNAYARLPTRGRFSKGYVPLIYQRGTASPWSVWYDNSISAGTGSTNHPVALTDDVSSLLSESISRVFTGSRTPSDDVSGSFSDSISRAWNGTRQITDTLPTFSESLTAARTFLRGITDDVSGLLSDSVTRSWNGTRAVTESVTSLFSDSVSRAATMTRSITDDVSSLLSDAISAAKNSQPGQSPMTMQSDTTHSVSWTSPSSGSDTETDYIAANSNGDGFALGINTSYSALLSAFFERLAGSVVNATGYNSVNAGSQISMGTTARDGHLHLLANTTATGNGSFAGSEDVTGYTVTEQAPAQTALRRYVKTSSGTINGLAYVQSACIWPGDPGFIVWRVDVTASSSVAMNGAGSTDNIEMCSPAGLLSNSGTGSNQGVWIADSTHSYYGTVGGTTTGGIPDGSSANTAGEPDFLAFLPKQNVGALANQRLGLISVKFTKWADVGLSAAGFASLTSSSRVKAKWGGNAGSSIAAGTYTFYVLEAIRTNLSTTDMAAIAADYLKPGSPSVTNGTLSTFTYPNHSGFPFNLDEAVYVVAAAVSGSSNRATVTLDLTPANVTVRFKPRLKVTGWIDTNAPRVYWGSTRLVSGTDYNWAYDNSGQNLYVALQFDSVASGAITGQRNNAALDIQQGSFLTTISDTILQTDTVSRAIVASRAVSDTLSTSDTIQRSAAFVRPVVDSTASLFSETVIRAWTGARSIADTALTSDTLQRVGSFLAQMSETLATSDTLQRAATLSRQITETLPSFSDSVSTARTFLRGITDTFATSDSVQRAASLTRQIADTLATSDTVQRVATYSRQIAESVSSLFSDAVTASRSFHAFSATITDTLTTTDGIQRLAALGRQVADSTTITDALQRAANYSRQISDSVSGLFSDALSASKNFHAFTVSLTESLTTADTVQRVAGYVRQTAETLATNDALQRSASYSRQVADSVQGLFSDVLAAVKSLFGSHPGTAATGIAAPYQCSAAVATGYTCTAGIAQF